jgi:hypothetical protein
LCLGFLISGTLSTLACQMLIYEGAAGDAECSGFGIIREIPL